MLRHKTGKQLESIAKLPDIRWSTSLYLSACKYTKGQVWSFWLENDPRFDDGINAISKFRCVKSGSEDSEWIEIKT